MNVISSARSLKKENNVSAEDLNYVLMIDNENTRNFISSFKRDISLFVKSKTFEITPFGGDIQGAPVRVLNADVKLFLKTTVIATGEIERLQKKEQKLLELTKILEEQVSKPECQQQVPLKVQEKDRHFTTITLYLFPIQEET
jgi:valyl-tRNA synthetase